MKEIRIERARVYYVYIAHRVNRIRRRKKKIEGERGNEHSKNRKVFNEIFAATGKMESVTSE